MPSVRCNISGVVNRARSAVRAVRARQYSEMQTILEQKIAEEKATHAYQNRTGDAEASTAVTGTISGDRFALQMGINVPYAIYLDRRGLTRIRELAAEARQEIRELLRDWAARIARGDF